MKVVILTASTMKKELDGNLSFRIFQKSNSLEQKKFLEGVVSK